MKSRKATPFFRVFAAGHFLALALLVIGHSPRALAIHLPDDDSWNKDFTVTITDTLSGVELSTQYKLTTDPHPSATLRARTISEPANQEEIPLSQVEVRFFHDQVRTAIRSFDLLDNAQDIRQLTKSLRLRIETATMSLEMGYTPQDRPSSESAVACYFWLLKKLPAFWQEKASWRSQFNAWTPNPLPNPYIESAEAQATVDSNWNTKNRSVTELSVPLKDLWKNGAWKIESAPPLKSTAELVEIAISRAQDYGLNPTHEVEGCSGIDWRKSDEGRAWFATIYLRTTLKKRDSLVQPKDGEVILAVPMLPDGTPIKVKTRPMTEIELENFGLKTRESPRDSRLEAPSDPFAPTPGIDKQQAK